MPPVLLIFILSALVFAACDDSEPETLTPEEARDHLQRLPESMSYVDQLKFEIRGTFDGLEQIPPELLNAGGAIVDPDAFGIIFSGSLDRANQQGHLRFEMPGMSMDTTDPEFREMYGDTFDGAEPADFSLFMEMIGFEDRTYMRGLFFSIFTGALPAQWVQVDDGEENFFTRSGQIDPVELVSFIDAIEGDVEIVGSEAVRGTDTTHVRFDASVSDLEELTGGDFGIFAFDEDLGTSRINAWLDSEGRLHKLEIAGPVGDSISFATGEETMGADYDITGAITLWLWDYNQLLDLKIPPDDEVIDANELEDGLFDGSGNAPSAPSEAPLTAEQRRYTDLVTALLTGLDEEQVATLEQDHPDLVERFAGILTNADDVTPEELAKLEALIIDVEAALATDIPDAP